MLTLVKTLCIGVKCQYVMILTMAASLRMLMLRTGILVTGRGLNCLRNDARALRL